MPGRYRRSVRLFGFLFLALLISSGHASPSIADEEVAVVVSAVEALIVKRGLAKPEDLLYSKDEVLVLRNGNLTFRFKDGRVMRLDGGSRARISHGESHDGAVRGNIAILVGQGWVVDAETGAETALVESMITDAGGDTASPFATRPDGEAAPLPGSPKVVVTGAGNSATAQESIDAIVEKLIQQDLVVGGPNLTSQGDGSGSDADVNGLISDDAAKDVPRKIGTGFTPETGESIADDVTRGKTREVTRGMTREVTRGMTREVTRGMTREATRDMAKEAAHGSRNSLSRGLSRRGGQ